MCKVSFADNSETVGHTGIARLCCSQRTARTRTDCLLLQEKPPPLQAGEDVTDCRPAAAFDSNAGQFFFWKK